MTKATASEARDDTTGDVTFHDGLGDRYLAADTDTGDLVERLQLIPELAAQERAIRERVDRLLHFRHVRFPRLHEVLTATVGQTKTVSLVAEHVRGLRLSQLLAFVGPHPTLVLDVNAVLQVAREILPAIGVLHDSRGVTHGAIAAERLVLTPQARVTIVDYALGAALGKLQYPRTRLWREFRIAMPPSAGIPRFDARADVANAALTVLALLTGQPLIASDFPNGIRSRLESVVERLANGTVRPLSAALKGWFERALPIEARRPFATAQEAQLALEEVLKKERAYTPSQASLKSLLQRYQSCQPNARPADAASKDATPRATVIEFEPARPEPARPAAPPSRAKGRSRRLTQEEEEQEEIRLLEAELRRLAEIDQGQAGAADGPGPAARADSPGSATVAASCVTETAASVDTGAAFQSRATAEGAATAASPTVGLNRTPIACKTVVQAAATTEPGAVAESRAIDETGAPAGTDAFTGREVAPSGDAPHLMAIDVPASSTLQALGMSEGASAPGEGITLEAWPGEDVVEIEIVALGGELPTLDVASLSDEATAVVMSSLGPAIDLLPSTVPTQADDDEIRDLERLLRELEHAGEPGAGAPEHPGPATAVEPEPTWTLTPLVAAECTAPVVAEDEEASAARDVWTLPLDFDAPPVYVQQLLAAGAAGEDLVARPGAIDRDDVLRVQLFAASAPGASGEASSPVRRTRKRRAREGVAHVRSLPALATPAAAGISARPERALDAIARGSVVRPSMLRLVPPRQTAAQAPPAALPAQASPVQAQLAVVPPSPFTHVAAANPGQAILRFIAAVSDSESAARLPERTECPGSVEPETAPEPPLVAAAAAPAGIEVLVLAPPDVGEAAPDAVASIDAQREGTSDRIEDPDLPSFAGDTQPEPGGAESLDGVLAQLLAVLERAEPLVDAGPDRTGPPASHALSMDLPVPEPAPPIDALPEAVVVEVVPAEPTPVALPDAEAGVSPATVEAASAEPSTAEVATKPGPTASAVDEAARDIEAELAAQAQEPPFAAEAERPSRRKRRARKARAKAPTQPATTPVPEEPVRPEPLRTPAVQDQAPSHEPSRVPLVAEQALRHEPWRVPSTAVLESASRPARAPIHPSRPLPADPWNVEAEAAKVGHNAVPVEREATTAPALPLPWAPPRAAALASERDLTLPSPRESVPVPRAGGDAAHAFAVLEDQFPISLEVVRRKDTEPVDRPTVAAAESTAPAEVPIRLLDEATVAGPIDSTSSLRLVGTVVPFERPQVAEPALDQASEPVPGVRAGGRGRIDWRRTAAASLAVILLEGVAFATAYWFVKPREMGSLLVQTAQPGVEVLIDGRRSGVTPLNVELKPGRYTLEMRSSGATKVIPVEISPGVQTTQSLQWPGATRVGAVKVTTNPTAARILVDGTFRGTAPLTIEGLAVGSHTIVAEAPSGVVKNQVKVFENDVTDLDVGIFSGWLSVFAPVEVRVFEAGRLLGTSLDGKLLVSAGPHDIELVNARLGYREKRTVEIEPGKHTPLSVDVPDGAILIEAPDGTEVAVDGRAVGTMPIERVKAPIGTREVVLKHPLIGERRVTVTVTADAPARVSLLSPQ